MTSMNDENEHTSSEEVGNLVDSVKNLGERARLLAVNLAVVAAKIKKQGTHTTRLNEDILDLVSRITRVSQEVSDSVKAMESGAQATSSENRGSFSGAATWQQVGVPDEHALECLTRSLNETLELSRHVFRWVRDHSKTTETPQLGHESSGSIWGDEGEKKSKT